MENFIASLETAPLVSEMSNEEGAPLSMCGKNKEGEDGGPFGRCRLFSEADAEEVANAFSWDGTRLRVSTHRNKCVQVMGETPDTYCEIRDVDMATHEDPNVRMPSMYQSFTRESLGDGGFEDGEKLIYRFNMDTSLVLAVGDDRHLQVREFNEDDPNCVWTHAVPDTEIPTLSPMELANIVADFREQINEVWTDEKVEEAVMSCEYDAEILTANIETEVHEFAVQFSEPIDWFEVDEDLWRNRCNLFTSKATALFDEKVEASNEEMKEAVHTDFEQYFEEMFGSTGGDEGTLEDVYAAKVEELANAFVEGHDFVNRLPDMWEEEKRRDEIFDAFKMDFQTRMAALEAEALMAGVADVDSALQAARQAEYMYEMSNPNDPYDSSGVGEALDNLRAVNDTYKEMCIDYLTLTAEEHQNEESAAALELREKNIAEFTEDAGYLKTRCDRTNAKGPRDIDEAYVKVSKITGSVGGNLDRITFWYNDGNYRYYGRDSFQDNEEYELNLDDGEYLAKVESWKIKKPGECYGEGVKFFNNAGDPIRFMGKNTNGTFFTDKKDSEFEAETAIVDLLWNEGHTMVAGIRESSVDKVPGGDWSNDVESFYMAGSKLIYEVNGESKEFVPLPHETLKIEDGRMKVDGRLMD